MKEHKKHEVVFPLLCLFIAISVGLAGFIWYGYQKYTNLNNQYLSTKLELEDTSKNLTSMTEMKNYLSINLDQEKGRNSEFENQINEISKTVGTLDKLSKTDKELLQKYSKIYFLNENYIPEALSEIPKDYLFDKNRVIKIHTKVLPYLSDMMSAAKNDGVDLKIVSGFRSFGEQSSLKSSYKLTYGSGANAFSADQGYSEHQLGTTMDFTTIEAGGNFNQFETTSAYKWLVSNASKYGFIISYPKNNKFYEYEPWHWRFVGKKLANKLFQEGQNFYDLDQRAIDPYLINIFD